MAISVSNAAPSFANKAKPQVGRHLCKVKDIREKNGHRGEGIRFDVSVVEGPTPVGFEFSPCIYPKNAHAQGNLSREQVQAKEEGKILKWLGAILGYSGGDVFRVTQAVVDGSVVRPVSPYAGRLVVVNVVGHINQKKEATVYYELYAVDEDMQAPFPLTAVAAPAAPPPPAPAAFPPPGWAPHTDPAYAAQGWYYCGELVKHRSDLGG